MLEFWVTKKLIESKKSLRTMVRFLTKLVRNLTKLVRNLGIYPEVRIALTGNPENIELYFAKNKGF